MASMLGAAAFELLSMYLIKGLEHGPDGFSSALNTVLTSLF